MVYSIKRPEYGISVLLSSCKMANIEKNRAVLKSISRAILFCGRQCIALQGDVEILEAPGNSGNFLALLKLLALHGDTLKSHMEFPVCEVTLVCLPELKMRLLR